MSLSGKELLDLIEDGEWKGLPQWQCALCKFDSVESKDVVIEHILRVHLPGARASEDTGRPLLVDARGNPIISAAPGITVQDVSEVEDDVSPEVDGDLKK